VSRPSPDGDAAIDPLLAERIRVAVDELREADLALAAMLERYRARADGSESRFSDAAAVDMCRDHDHLLRMERAETTVRCLRMVMLVAITMTAGLVVFRCLQAPAAGGHAAGAEVIDAR
jgi:hypothetical protein